MPKRGSPLSSPIVMCVLAIVAMAALAPTVSALGSAGGMFDPFRKWTVTQRLRDNGVGQSFYNFSDSMHLMGRYAVTCSMSANRGIGRCLVWFDAGQGMQNVAIVTDTAGQIGDQFGYKCLLFRRLGATHLAVTALSKNSDGAVLVFRQVRASPSSPWVLQQTLTPPNSDGTYAASFGRQLAFDGYSVIVGAVARYQFSQRYVISATNIRGTSLFFESTGTGAIPGDPVFAFATAAGRGNSTTLSLYQTFRGAPYTYDFGASMALSPDGNTLAVGASPRPQALFGYGTDGDLVVTGIKLLDGTATYNFNTVTIMPNGTLTVDPYDPLRGAGGILRMLIKTSLVIHPGGVINMSAHGFDGAATRTEGSVTTNGGGPGGGKSSTSIYVGDTACQYNDGSLSGVTISSTGAKRNATSLRPYAEANGGGGGYGTPGSAGTAVQCGSSGNGGVVNGDPYVADLQRGSGGGSGQPWSVGSGGAGGTGGGAVYIAAPTIINNGIITADGGNGEAGSFYSGGGGGGSGGSIYLRGNIISNGGYIFARGGKGGFRSRDSGSNGNSDVKGGDGGKGRIRLDFLSTTSRGVVNPYPLNNTGYSGDVYIFSKIVANQSWTLKTTVPRIRTMRYTGHAVALSNTQIAVASDDQDASNPTQSVFVISLSVIKNSTSSFVGQYRQIMAPHPAVDRLFGYGLALFNNTLVVSAAGNAASSGSLYMISGVNLLWRTDLLMNLVSGMNYKANFFAQAFSYEYPQVLIQVPFEQDDGFVSTRMSTGCVQLVKHLTNISSVTSTITCQYQRATANTTVTCTFNARDLRGAPAGDINDVALISYPSGITYVSRGAYTFTVPLRKAGSWPIYVIHNGRRINGLPITVTNAIRPWATNLTCAPLNPNGGDTVTCTIQTFGSTGEQSATPYFRATVYHTDDILLQTVATDQLTAFGTYRTPPSSYIVAPVNATDYPTVSPTVSFVRIGYYQFSFTAWRPGQIAAFVQYQNIPLAFPNPVVLDVGEPVISASSSSIVCPTIAAPNRTLICTLTLISAAKVPTNNAVLALNYSSASRYVRATLTSPTGVVTKLPITSLWAQEGRISVLVYPTRNGTLSFAGEYKKASIPMIPPGGVTISTNFAMTCLKMSSLLTAFTILNQQAMGRADASRWGTGATLAKYVEGSGMCDNGYV